MNTATKKAPVKETFAETMSVKGDSVKDFWNNFFFEKAAIQREIDLATIRDVQDEVEYDLCEQCSGKMIEHSGEIDSDELVYWSVCEDCNYQTY